MFVFVSFNEESDAELLLMEVSREAMLEEGFFGTRKEIKVPMPPMSNRPAIMVMATNRFRDLRPWVSFGKHDGKETPSGKCFWKNSSVLSLISLFSFMTFLPSRDVVSFFPKLFCKCLEPTTLEHP